MHACPARPEEILSGEELLKTADCCEMSELRILVPITILPFLTSVSLYALDEMTDYEGSHKVEEDLKDDGTSQEVFVPLSNMCGVYTFYLDERFRRSLLNLCEDRSELEKYTRSLLDFHSRYAEKSPSRMHRDDPILMCIIEQYLGIVLSLINNEFDPFPGDNYELLLTAERLLKEDMDKRSGSSAPIDIRTVNLYRKFFPARYNENP